MDVHVRETDISGDDPFPELMLEVSPEIEVLPEAESLGSPEPDPCRASVPLHRLLDRAKPSLAEAASLAATVLEAVADLHDSGRTHGHLDSQSVRLSPDVGVRLAGPEGAAGVDDGRRRADIAAAAAIVADIDKATGRPARALTDREERLAVRLTTAADPRSLARRGLRRAARGLDLAVGRSDQREVARQGVAGLVRAVTGFEQVAVGAASADGSRPGGRSAPPRKLPPPARRPPLWPRVWKPLAIVTAVLLVLGIEVHFFADDVKRNVDRLLNGKAEAAAGPKQPAPLPDLGPPAAGPISHVELRPLDRCRPEEACNVVVQVAVQPQTAPLDVAWNFELVDRCGALREPRPGGVLSVPPGHDRAVSTATVALPAGRALALVPVTTSPARAAGTALPLYPADRTC